MELEWNDIVLSVRGKTAPPPHVLVTCSFMLDCTVDAPTIPHISAENHRNCDDGNGT
jgi:hypothetical protein